MTWIGSRTIATVAEVPAIRGCIGGVVGKVDCQTVARAGKGGAGYRSNRNQVGFSKGITTRWIAYNQAYVISTSRSIHYAWIGHRGSSWVAAGETPVISRCIRRGSAGKLHRQW